MPPSSDSPDSPRPRRRRLRRALVALLAVVALAAVAGFAFGPGIVENGMNRISDDPRPDVGQETSALHDDLLIVDMHSDTLMWDRDLLGSTDRGHMDLSRLEEGNVTLQVFSSVSKSPKDQNYDSNSDETDNITLLSVLQLQPPRTWTSLLERSLYHAEKLDDAAERSDGRLSLVRDQDDLAELVAARQDGSTQVGALFSLEGLHNLEGDLDNLQVLFDAGARMAGFTHFFDNEVAGSMHGVEKGGLTDLGRDVLAEMERLGMVVDLAHSSEEAVEEILSLATRPVVTSHGGVQATCDVNRNLSDDQIRGIAATGGVVGIGYWDAAVCDTTPGAVVDAIEHVIEVGGIETAALGSDFDGATTVGWDTSQIAVITQELMDRGHSEADIAAIMGGNTLRVLGEVLPE